MPGALLIVDHGSTQEAANEMLKEVRTLLKRQRPDLIVHIAHMELAEPTLAQGFAACVRDGATEVVVHPYMLSPGRHAGADIPRMASQAAQKFPGIAYRCTEPLGLHEKIAEVVLERAGFV